MLSDLAWHALRVQEVRGLVLVNPATSYERSALARIGPICASLQGPLLYPLYLLSLVGFAALVLTPTYQAPAFISMLAFSAIAMSQPRSRTSSGIPSMTFLSLGSTEEVRNWSLNPRGWFRGNPPGVATRTPVPHHAVKSA